MSDLRKRDSLIWRLVGLVLLALLFQGALTFAVVVFNLSRFVSENAEQTRSFIFTREQDELRNIVQMGYDIIVSYHERSQDIERLKEEKYRELKKVVDAVVNQVEAYYEQHLGLMPMDELEEDLKDLVKSARFDNGNYLWINDTHPRMVMHPTNPSLDGKDLSSFKDPEGTLLFVDMVKVTRSEKEGVVTYMWPKPGETVPKPKISYVRLFEPLGWIIGSGAWIEDIVTQMKEEALNQVAKMRLPDGNYFWINDTHPRMVMHPIKPSLNGQDLSSFEDTKGKRLFVEMAKVATAKGEGFVDYWWPKPGEDPDESFPKESFVKLFEPWGWIIGMGTYVDDIDAAVTSQSLQFKNAMWKIILQIGIYVSLFLAVVILVLVWFFQTKLRRPLNSLVYYAGQVAEGNLEAELQGRFSGEIQELKASVETMVASLKTKMKEVKEHEKQAMAETEAANRFRLEAEEAHRKAENANKEGLLQAAELLEGVVQGLSALSSELARQVQQASEGSQIQRQRSSETATAMEEMNATVYEVAKNASNASEGADSARARASEGEEIVRRSVNANDRVSQVTGQLSETMHALGKQTEAIGQIMNVISDIADQTNLLALNAAIEAARAGDAGRGFAVVADEVRKLAEKTMTATKEVGEAIKSIQDGTRNNIASVEQATAAVEEARELANQSGEALETILGLVQATSDQVRGIATAAEEQSAASEEINKAVDDVNRISSETAEGMMAAENLIHDLSELTDKLNAMVEELRQA